MGNKNSKRNKSDSIRPYKNCKECWTYKQYRHCCYNVCFATIFDAHGFVDVLETEWIFTSGHEIELYNILLPLELSGVIPIISVYLPKKKKSDLQKSTTPKHKENVLRPFKLMTREERSLSVPFYVPNVNVSSTSYNTSKTEIPTHAYFHGYISLYNRNRSPCFTWMKTLPFDEYDDSDYGPKKKTIQITVLGDVGVGKSTLINRYLNDEFNDNYMPTIVDCYTKTVSLNDEEYEHKKKFSGLDFDINQMEQNILDTAGGDVIAMAGSLDEWIEQGQVFLLCFDISRGLTLQYLKAYIIPRIQQHFEGKDKNDESSHIYSMDKSNHIGPCGLVLVGCKVDLRNGKNKGMNVEITKNYEKAMRLAKDMSIPYIETSSKSSVNVNFLFKQCVFEYWIQTQTNCIQWRSN